MMDLPPLSCGSASKNGCCTGREFEIDTVCRIQRKDCRVRGIGTNRVSASARGANDVRGDSPRQRVHFGPRLGTRFDDTPTAEPRLAPTTTAFLSSPSLMLYRLLVDS